MEKYRIIRFERYNKKGELVTSYFYVQKKLKIWKWTYWVYVRENQSTLVWPESSMRMKMKFKFITEAQHFIEDVLVPGKPYDTEKTTVVEAY